MMNLLNKAKQLATIATAAATLTSTSCDSEPQTNKPGADINNRFSHQSFKNTSEFNRRYSESQCSSNLLDRRAAPAGYQEKVDELKVLLAKHAIVKTEGELPTLHPEVTAKLKEIYNLPKAHAKESDQPKTAIPGIVSDIGNLARTRTGYTEIDGDLYKALRPVYKEMLSAAQTVIPELNIKTPDQLTEAEGKLQSIIDLAPLGFYDDSNTIQSFYQVAQEAVSARAEEDLQKVSEVVAQGIQHPDYNLSFLDGMKDRIADQLDLVGTRAFSEPRYKVLYAHIQSLQAEQALAKLADEFKQLEQHQPFSSLKKINSAYHEYLHLEMKKFQYSEATQDFSPRFDQFKIKYAERVIPEFMQLLSQEQAQISEFKTGNINKDLTFYNLLQTVTAFKACESLDEMAVGTKFEKEVSAATSSFREASTSTLFDLTARYVLTDATHHGSMFPSDPAYIAIEHLQKVTSPEAYGFDALSLECLNSTAKSLRGYVRPSNGLSSSIIGSDLGISGSYWRDNRALMQDILSTTSNISGMQGFPSTKSSSSARSRAEYQPVKKVDQPKEASPASEAELPKVEKE